MLLTSWGRCAANGLNVSTHLSLCSLPVGKDSVRSKGCDYVVRSLIGMTVLRPLLDLTEHSLLCCIVLILSWGMFEQIGLASLMPIFLPTLGKSSPFAGMDQH